MCGPWEYNQVRPPAAFLSDIMRLQYWTGSEVGKSYWESKDLTYLAIVHGQANERCPTVCSQLQNPMRRPWQQWDPGYKPHGLSPERGAWRGEIWWLVICFFYWLYDLCLWKWRQDSLLVALILQTKHPVQHDNVWTRYVNSYHWARRNEIRKRERKER